LNRTDVLAGKTPDAVWLISNDWLAFFSIPLDDVDETGIDGVSAGIVTGFTMELYEKGIITKHKPSKSQLRDIEYGMNLAKRVSELDIGQTVVVKDQIILAVEAIEGKDYSHGCRYVADWSSAVGDDYLGICSHVNRRPI
jgi:hypothetical protein